MITPTIQGRAPFIRCLISLSILLLSGCASTGGYISGQVLDADTKEPIPEAHVVIIWEGDRFAFVETQTVCVHADGTLTDEEGKFRFLPWAGLDGVVPVSDVYGFIYV